MNANRYRRRSSSYKQTNSYLDSSRGHNHSVNSYERESLLSRHLTYDRDRERHRSERNCTPSRSRSRQNKSNKYNRRDIEKDDRNNNTSNDIKIDELDHLKRPSIINSLLNTNDFLNKNNKTVIKTDKILHATYTSSGRFAGRPQFDNTNNNNINNININNMNINLINTYCNDNNNGNNGNNNNNTNNNNINNNNNTNNNNNNNNININISNNNNIIIDTKDSINLLNNIINNSDLSSSYGFQGPNMGSLNTKYYGFSQDKNFSATRYRTHQKQKTHKKRSYFDRLNTGNVSSKNSNLNLNSVNNNNSANNISKNNNNIPYYFSNNNLNNNNNNNFDNNLRDDDVFLDENGTEDDMAGLINSSLIEDCKNNSGTLNTAQNNYTQHFIDTRLRPSNFLRELSRNNRLSEYPKLRQLSHLKLDQIRFYSTIPMYKNVDLKRFDLSSLNLKFDVILIDPPWKFYVDRCPGAIENLDREVWTFSEMYNLKVQELSENPSFVFLWCGNGSNLNKGRILLKKWGYKRCEVIAWLKTNKNIKNNINIKNNLLNKYENIPNEWDINNYNESILARSIEHCLMGIKGQVRRSTDSHLIHANVDTDIIITENPPYGSTKKPYELYQLIEKFCLGRKRIELFGDTHNIRPGWITLGNKLPLFGKFDIEYYKNNVNNLRYVPSTKEIETLRPKSPPRNIKK